MGEQKRQLTLVRRSLQPVDARRSGGAAVAPSSASTPSLDDIDLAIIRLLQEDGRTPFTTIARELDISEGAVRNRVGQLQEARVLRIIGVADPMALGYDAFAMVGLKVAPGHDPQKAAQYFSDRDEVTYVLFVAGRYDLLIEVICETHDELAKFLRKHCYGRTDIASVEPMVGLAMYKSMLKWGQP